MNDSVKESPPWRHYTVEMTAVASVKARETIFADSLESAKSVAMKRAEEGNCFWTYDGIPDGADLEITSIKAQD